MKGSASKREKNKWKTKLTELMGINRLQDSSDQVPIVNLLILFSKRININLSFSGHQINRPKRKLFIHEWQLCWGALVSDEKFRTNRLSVDRKDSTKLFSWDFCWMFTKCFHYYLALWSSRLVASRQSQWWLCRLTEGNSIYEKKKIVWFNAYL